MGRHCSTDKLGDLGAGRRNLQDIWGQGEGAVDVLRDCCRDTGGWRVRKGGNGVRSLGSCHGNTCHENRTCLYHPAHLQSPPQPISWRVEPGEPIREQKTSHVTSSQ